MCADRSPFAAMRQFLRSLRQAGTAGAARAHQRGQVLPIFVILAVVLIGGAALLTDVAWWWTNEQRMQRAADAAALAGAVYLPGNQSLAFSAAQAEAVKNGITNGVAGAIVRPRRDPNDPRKLIVDVEGPVNTNFAGVFCWDGGPCLRSVDVGVTGAASYVLPVPMGSPQNYYGVGYLVDATTTTTVTPISSNTGFNAMSNYLSGQWSNPGNAISDNNAYTSEATNNQRHVWYNFRLAQEIPDDPTTVIEGIEVQLNDARILGSGSPSTDCRVTAEVTWNRSDALTWSDPLQSDPISTASYVDRLIGSSSNIAAWGGHAWTRDDLLDANFAVRLTWNDGTAGCNVGRSVNLDQLNVRVYYSYDQTTTTTVIEPKDVESPLGDVLVPHGFWGALQSQGAPNIQGDAYMTYWDTRTSVVNDEYGPDAFYQYGIEFPAGSSGGEVWLFDPGFCHVDTDKGTGESYTLGGSNGSSTFNPVSTFYDLWNTRNTPYDLTDDTLVYSSGNAYRQTTWRDSLLDVGSPVTADPCDDLAWHNDWVRIAQGLSGNRTYRLHTYSTDPNDANDQRQTTALNAFAIWSTASGGTPRVYGLGAMEAYVRLPGGQSTEFYLAQIDAEHAGKTLAIGLWDPGDTGNLSANLQILQPTPTGYTVVPFNYTAAQGSGNATNCNSRSGTNVTSVTTSTPTSLFNGCWLNIEIPLPITYDAPLPSTETVATEGGWWKIRYNMSGSTGSFSTDLTTWEVAVRGNPVHLVVE